MVPVAGLLRIYSGDIGDACYTSKHEELARNEYPRLHAWIYVTDRNKPSESLRGSLLGIQTTREDQTPTLVARANNPQENFIQSVDAEDFVNRSLKEVIATARRFQEARTSTASDLLSAEQGRQCVVIPLDTTTRSLTNRDPVRTVCKKLFGKLTKVGLKNEAETNFNGYNIWNKAGSHACVTIWEMDEDGKETWYGDWELNK